MTAKEAAAKLAVLEQKLNAYNHAMGVIHYDSATAAPAGSAAERGETLGILSGVYYELFAIPEVGELLETVLSHREELDALTVKKAEIMKRDYDETSKIPQDEYIAFTRLCSDAENVWHRAKVENDFAAFAPYIDRIVETLVRFAGYYEPGKAPYDVWLSNYEKGLNQKTLDSFFGSLRENIVPLLHRIQTEAAQVDDSFLHQDYPVEQQKKFSAYLMDVIGIDKNYCAIGETEHPFTTNFSKHDVRITTHYYEDHPEFSMYSVIHEGGHALYELHTGDELIGSSLAAGTTMGIHESQSRLFENMIGRSEPFVEYVFPKMQELFPEQLASVTAHQMYLALNKCEPSLIRTEADELTYSLHIMVRYEIEKKLFKGEAKAKDLPALWQEMMHEYLGIDVPDDAHGVLQDSHWSNAQMGYFPSYAIGSAYAAQFVAHMKKTVDVEKAISTGDLKPVEDWLCERIWRFGRGKDPAEILEIACGEPFDPAYYTKYLTEKFSAIYGLN